MKRHSSLFSYRNADSFVHRIPAWIKLLFLMTVTFRIFSSGSEFTVWTRVVFYLVLCLLLWLLAKTPISSLFRLKFLVFLATFMITASLLNHTGIKNDLLYISRFFVTMMASTVVFETTSRLELLDFFSNAENTVSRIIPPLKKLNLSLIFAVSLTFIPEIFSCWSRVLLSASARTQVNSKGKRVFSPGTYTTALGAFFLSMLHYAEDVRMAIQNRR